LKPLLLTLALALPPNPYTAEEDQALADGIKWLVSQPKGRVELYLKPHFGTRALTDPKYRMELAIAFREAGELFGIPKELLAAMAYRETVFRPGEVGRAGELGLLQVGKLGRRSKACRDYCGEVTTIKGGALCGACWLADGRRMCGSLERGLNAYVSGRCKPSVRAGRVAQIRIKLWRKLEERRDD
jgi:hypothetical protein